MAKHTFDLVVAILRKAKSDYIIALKNNNFTQKAKLEAFFLSEWGENLSNNHGTVIIEYCQKRVKEIKKND